MISALPLKAGQTSPNRNTLLLVICIYDLPLGTRLI
jgi:hypothetical protein